MPLPEDRHRLGFVIEYLIGHKTFARLIQDAVRRDKSIDAEFFLVDWTETTLLERLPFVRSNWSLRASAKSTRSVLPRISSLDALFIHTQSAALFSPFLHHYSKIVISADATPRNLDSVASSYDHRVGMRLEESAKQQLSAFVYRRADAIVAWSEWTAQSLVEDYGVDCDRVRVIRPGLVLSEWTDAHRATEGPVKLLFVGGEFERKGGAQLLEACRRLSGDWVLDIVTRSDVAASDKVRVHGSLQSNDPTLFNLYRDADIFVFPTLGDCLPWVIVEAMAAGLPIVTTGVGAIPEVVHEEDNGLLVAPGDVDALARTLQHLIKSPQERIAMGANSRRRAERDHNAERNFPEIFGLLTGLAAAPQR